MQAECSNAKTECAARPGKYLTFVLGGESYGIGILQVREILRATVITPVPHVPPHIRGVINLRGKIIPVLDLRAKFGLAACPGNDRSCIIVAQIDAVDSPAAQTGLLVDAVDEVIQLAGDDIEPPPDFGRRLDARHLLGIAKTGAAVKILLDLERIISDEMPARA